MSVTLQTFKSTSWAACLTAPLNRGSSPPSLLTLSGEKKHVHTETSCHPLHTSTSECWPDLQVKIAIHLNRCDPSCVSCWVCHNLSLALSALIRVIRNIMNALQNREVIRIEHMITEGESNWYSNKFSHYLCWKKMYREKKWEFYFWYYFV